MVAEFWSAQCPQRGPALGHVHWERCDPRKPSPHDPSAGLGHLYRQCCHCGQFAPKDDEVAPPESMPQVDIDARLLALGLGPEESDDTIRADDAPVERNEFLEPKMATIGKPDYGINHPWERGRSWRGDGGLSPRDKDRLGVVIHLENTRGYR